MKKLREEFEKEWRVNFSYSDEGLVSVTAIGQEIADWWLSHIDTLLGEIEGKIEDKLKGRDKNSADWNYGYDSALDDIKSIINSYRQNE